MIKGIWLLLIATLLVACARSKLIDDTWTKNIVVGYWNISIGNHTLWKALYCCADNDTVRPSNETRLINYVNDTWCKGNTTCM
mgnify:CR=1 FL=1